MALITNLETLNYAYGGRPFVLWTSPALGTSQTLDHAYGGQPYYAQFETQPVLACVVTVSAPTVRLKTLNRDFPNKREENVRETQIKHAVPAYTYQDPALIP